MDSGSGSPTDWKGPAFRRMLVQIVRRRVPERDVEDIVQATLTCALSPSAPTDDQVLQRWLIGVAKHKSADRHRRGQRESFDLPELTVDAPPHAENDLMRWAERVLPADAEEPRRTLEWMIREGDGEKLESIAESEQIPAPRLRKRVSRLRRYLRAEWKKEIALLAALGIVAVLIWLARRGREPVAHEPIRPLPMEMAPAPRAPALGPSAAPVPPPPPVPAPTVAPSPSSAPTSSSPSPRGGGHAKKTGPAPTGTSL
jgi:DNA-directed RNA polymerase specialized sigma24 family protein